MVVNDYGKRAYHLVCELEKRIEKIEKNTIESVYNEVIFNFSDTQNLNSYTKTFSVNALKENKYIISSLVNVNANLENVVSVSVYVNDVLAYSFTNTQSVDYQFSFEATFLKGVNIIKTVCVSTVDFQLNSLNFKICGTVNYVESNNFLSHLLHNGVDYIGHVLNDKLILYKYTSVLDKVKEVPNVVEINFLGVYKNVLCMTGVDSKRSLLYLEFNLKNNAIFIKDIGVNNVSSVCGYLNIATAVLYFSKLNEVYKGYFLLGNEFNYEKTGRKGIKVFQDSNCPEKYVVIDKLLNTKLIVN